MFLDGNHLVVTKEEKVLSQVYGYFILKNDKVAWEELENYIMDIIYDNLKYITDPWTYQFFNDELHYLTNTSGNRTKFYKWKQRKF